MSPEYAFDAAVMMMRNGRRQEAADLCWEVVRLNPKHADAWALRAMVESEAGRYANAMLHHGFALQAAPDRYDLWCNRAIDAASARMYKEAEEGFKRSLALQESFEGHFNYGNVLATMMRLEEAKEQFELAFKFDKHDNAQLRVNYGEVLMALGDWKNGFKNYRHRFNAPGFPPHPRIKWPAWKGEPLDGKTILLFAEQGFGDEIQSIRFAGIVKNDIAAKEPIRVILAVRPPVYRLARSYADVDDVILMYDTPPVEPDYQCALLDVPSIIEVSPITVGERNGYLKAEKRGFRLKMPPGYNVGVCWSSGKRDLQPHVAATAAAKSLSFDQLVRPLARPGLNLYSLQQHHNDDAALRELGVIDPMPGVTDFADTAFFIDHLDLVITVDTSVAHLAGAMGKQVWNMVRHDAIWPWMQEKGPTCWYSSMHIYRQDRPFDWKEPLIRMRQDLKALLDRQAAA